MYLLLLYVSLLPHNLRPSVITEVSKSRECFTSNKCIGDDTKAATRQSSNCIKNKKNYKIWRKTIFNMADGILTPCNVAGGSGMTCHWIRPNVRHIGILHLVSISTTSSPSTCHSAQVSEILSKSDHRRQKKMTSCRFSRWRISAILDFRGPIMGSLKSPCATSYKSLIDTIALDCLVFEKMAFFLHFGDKQTDKQTDGQHRSTKPLSLSRAAA